MKDGTCIRCRYYFETKRECRLNPPTPLNVYPSGIEDRHTELTKSVYPKVDWNDWCSFYKDGVVDGVKKTNPEMLSEKQQQ